MPDPIDQHTWLDADPIIPTGLPATAEQVAKMVADPDLPLTIDVLPELPAAQRPTLEQIEAAAEDGQQQ